MIACPCLPTFAHHYLMSLRIGDMMDEPVDAIWQAHRRTAGRVLRGLIIVSAFVSSLLIVNIALSDMRTALMRGGLVALILGSIGIAVYLDARGRPRLSSWLASIALQTFAPLAAYAVGAATASVCVALIGFLILAPFLSRRGQMIAVGVLVAVSALCVELAGRAKSAIAEPWLHSTEVAGVAVLLGAAGLLITGYLRQAQAVGAELEASVKRRTAALEAEVVERQRAQVALREARVDRALAGRIITELMAGNSSREVGAALATMAKAQGIDDIAATYRRMGLGSISVQAMPVAGGWEATGRDLLERRQDARQPTCDLTVGYLEAALALEGGHERVLGSEIACQSMGAPTCAFRLSVRS